MRGDGEANDGGVGVIYKIEDNYFTMERWSLGNLRP